MPLSFVTPGGADDDENCPCAKFGTFPFFNCAHNAKRIYIHAAVIGGGEEEGAREGGGRGVGGGGGVPPGLGGVGGSRWKKREGDTCRSLPVDSGVMYFFEKSETARYENRHTDVSVRSCPTTDIVT